MVAGAAVFHHEGPMFYEKDPGAGCSVTWPAAVRGGGGEPLGIIVAVRVGAVDGLGNSGIVGSVDSGTGESLTLSISDNGEISVTRYNAADGFSRSTGMAPSAGLVYFWVDIPTAMLTGTNPTAYAFTDEGSAEITLTGATSPAGTAANLDGEASITIGNDSKGHWKLERLYVFVGTDRPDTAAEARAVALGDVEADEYTGLVFSAALGEDAVDSESGVTGTVAGGMFEVITGMVSMLNATCAILRSKSAVGENTGGPVFTFSTFTDEALCHVQDGGSSESLANRRQTGATGLNVFLECGRDVRNGDRIELVEASLGTRLLSVIGPPVMDPHRAYYTMVPCEEIQGGGGT